MKRSNYACLMGTLKINKNEMSQKIKNDKK